ncbi:MAG: diaminopimelate epimerase, partial [Synergistaceae bacterium]|nr:diaminopimelate epimerase [Synergistaceae bacterium]
ADGLILILPTPNADAFMQLYNSDGSSDTMCGNGIRCVAKYVYEHGLFHRTGGSLRLIRPLE